MSNMLWDVPLQLRAFYTDFIVFFPAERDLPTVSRSLKPMLFERSERATNSGDEKIYQIRHVGDLPMFRFG
uniref:Uncharacterized protein n=1 Tax=Parascaris equorum TaxID=6256 RepID=A0A914RWR3_PAREQ